MHNVAQEHKYEASKIRQFSCEAVMKWYIQQCLCIVTVRSMDINHAVSARMECREI